MVNIMMVVNHKTNNKCNKCGGYLVLTRLDNLWCTKCCERKNKLNEDIININEGEKNEI